MIEDNLAFPFWTQVLGAEVAGEKLDLNHGGQVVVCGVSVDLTDSKEVTIISAEIRSLFPVCGDSVYLNNAAESPLNVRVRQRLEKYLFLASHEPQKKPAVRQPVRVALSQLFGGTPDEYALVTSTGVGIGIAASGYDWQPPPYASIPVSVPISHY